MGNYLGRNLDRISNIEILDNITFDGSSSYSITKNSVPFVVNSAQSLLISIDGVVNATNFTVNGSTIDFGVAVPSTSVCNFFLHYGTGVMTVPSDGSVTTAKMFSGFKNGITEADQWRLSANTNTGTDADVTSNWERVDTDGFNYIGTGLTETSGIFSFAQTGIYLIIFSARIDADAGERLCDFLLKTTTDNSTYDNASVSTVHNRGGSDAFGVSTNTFIFDVTDVTTHKVKFTTSSFGGTSQLIGATDRVDTGFSVVRLGDT